MSEKQDRSDTNDSRTQIQYSRSKNPPPSIKETRTKSRRLATKLEAGNIGVETVSLILLTFRIQLRKRKELSM
jgi:hypothetical protein